MSKPMVQLSVTNFHFVKSGLIKHVLFVRMGLDIYRLQQFHINFKPIYEY